MTAQVTTRRGLIPALASLLLLALSPVAQAGGLTFDTTYLEVNVEPGTKTVSVIFPFQNTSQIRQKVHHIDSNCGCLSAISTQRLLDPGETGQIQAEFLVKGKVGAMEKHLTVNSGRGVSDQTKLTVRVIIPRAIYFEPQMVTWTKGDSPTAKRIRMVVNIDDPVQVLKIESSRRTVNTKLHTVEPGRIYEIEVIPETTQSPMLGVVRIETDCSVPDQSRQMAYFRIDKAS